MIIAVASGKGGTGKTLVSTSLALSLAGDILPVRDEMPQLPDVPMSIETISNGVQSFDCDVEEPNASFFIKPKIEKKEPIYLPKPIVELSHCTGCGKCAEVCQYNAIAIVKKKVLIFNELCHSCGACFLACPEKAIFEVDSEKGVLEGGQYDNIEFWQGSLKVGEAAPTPLIKALKKKVDNKKTVIIDSSPGTSCPMVEAVKDADFVILVTEPTPFGMNDLNLAVEVVKQLGIPFGVIINRSDIGDDKVESYCKKENISILMRIPFKREIAIAYSKGEPMVEAFPAYKKDFQKLFNTIKKQTNNE
jgi:MinD superfamily P-loop ATPase